MTELKVILLVILLLMLALQTYYVRQHQKLLLPTKRQHAHYHRAKHRFMLHVYSSTNVPISISSPFQIVTLQPREGIVDATTFHTFCSPPFIVRIQRGFLKRKEVNLEERHTSKQTILKNIVIRTVPLTDPMQEPWYMHEEFELVQLRHGGVCAVSANFSRTRPSVCFVCGKSEMFKCKPFYSFCLNEGYNFSFFCYATHSLARMKSGMPCSLDSTLSSDDLDTIVADLRVALDIVGPQVHLVSYSFGGLCSTLMLKRGHHKNVLDHVLLSPFLHGSSFSPLFSMPCVVPPLLSLCSPFFSKEQSVPVLTRSKMKASFVSTVIRSMFPVAGEFAKYDVNCIPATSKNFVVASMRAIEEVQAQAKTITTRSLCIVSETDRVLNAHDIAQVCDKICQDLTIIDMPSVGHDIMAHAILDPFLTTTFFDNIQSFWQKARATERE